MSDSTDNNSLNNLPTSVTSNNTTTVTVSNNVHVSDLGNTSNKTVLVPGKNGVEWVAVATEDETEELKLMVEILFKTLGLANTPIPSELQALLFDKDKTKRDIAKKILNWLQPEKTNE